MSGNSFGLLYCVTSFGESHGPAIGCVVDGCPPGLALEAGDIQRELDRRRPGTSRHVTQRREPDTVEILSGVFEGRTTGELCRQLKDPRQNGGKSLDQILYHAAKDELVGWGWDPGDGRTKPSMSREEFARHMREWIEAGAACPD